MNILPKKKWHVRTKENIERVRRDEAKAAEDERERERRQRLAEQEARTSLLRSRARERLGGDGAKELKGPDGTKNLTGPEGEAEPSKSIEGFDGGGSIESVTAPSGHVNFFQNLEEGEKLAKGNEEHEAEKKKEQEEYEKKIGYLTYLGQDTEELTGEKVWWRKLPVREEATESGTKPDVANKQKQFLDPLKDLKKQLGCEHTSLSLKKHVKSDKLSLKRKRSSSPEDRSKDKKKKRKKEKSKERRKSKKHKDSDSEKDRSRRKKKKKKKVSSSSESSDDEEERRRKNKTLERLRRERLEREKKERERSNRLLHGEPENKEPEDKTPSLKQSYNSQFNPTLARQNKLDPKTKYWLQ